jgi:hypothetical protein
MFMTFLTLTRSGKAVLVHCSDGQVDVTSVTYLKMLLDGKMRGNMLACTNLSRAKSALGDVKPGPETVDKVDGLDVFQ